MAWSTTLSTAALLGCACAQAGSLSVMPVVVGLSAQKSRESITVTNQASQSSTIQVDVRSWTQRNGQDVFDGTAEVLINPEVFTLEPGQSQILRMGWRGDRPLDAERTYRIFLREVPPAAARSPGATGAEASATPTRVQVLLELRIPVYVAPRQAAPSLTWSARQTDERHIEVKLRNQGNVHAVVHDLQLSTSSGERIGPALGVNAAVLAGQERVWRLPSPTTAQPDLGVDVRVNHDRQRLSIRRSCGGIGSPTAC